jgi:mannose-6-phosphate isomerase-like protein (cupin superfamily)
MRRRQSSRRSNGIPSDQLFAKFGLFHEQWQPKVIAEMNDYQFKVVKLQGDFIWHDHKDTDETFIVIEGDLRIDFRNGAVHIRAGEMFVVPKRVEHKPTPRTRSSCS